MTIVIPQCGGGICHAILATQDNIGPANLTNNHFPRAAVLEIYEIPDK